MKETDIIDEILSRGVEEVIDRDDFEEKLRSGKKLRLKLGIDPTSGNIHIGRAVSLWKLQQLQQLGHTIIFIVGDFTALIGDTSDKDSERPMLTAEQVAENLKGYIEQAGKILDIEKTEIHYNSEWLSKLGFLEICEMADEFSLHEFAARENISKRMKENKRVSLREVLYPLMQGYDSVAIDADFEIGGTDQRFNLLAGRVLQRHYNKPSQNIMTMRLIEGTDGRKMSSSWGNVINVMDQPEDMYGKVMSILDELIIPYFISCTRVNLEEVEDYKKQMASGKMNPRDAKAVLAREIVLMYYGEESAVVAAANFDKVHKNKEIPDEMPEFSFNGETILKVLIDSGIAKSGNEAKRLVDQGGVKIDGVVVADYDAKVSASNVIQSGKRNFLKIV
jgi:tyrosyl-tRNA synthetase